MTEAFLDLDNNVKLMLTSENRVILYDTFMYDSYLLDKLYDLFSKIKPDTVMVITHAVYDTSIYNNSYVISKEQIGNYIYSGYVSHLDLNKLMCLFNAAKINNVKFFDKMIMYEYFINDGCCGVDFSNNTYLLLTKNGSFSDLCYSKSHNLEQSMLQICRKHNVKKIMNFTNFIDYDCVKGFENYVDVLELPVYVSMTIFGFFRFIKGDAFFDINQIKFNSNLETVNYDSIKNHKVKSACAKADKTMKDSRHTVIESQDESVNPSLNKKSPTPSKKPSACRFCLVANVLIAIMTVVVYIANLMCFDKVSQLKNDYSISILSNSHLETKLTKLNNTQQYETCDIYKDVISETPDSVLVGSITIGNELEVVYYVPVELNIDLVTESISEKYQVQAVSNSGILAVDNASYNKYVVALTKQ